MSIVWSQVVGDCVQGRRTNLVQFSVSMRCCFILHTSSEVRSTHNGPRFAHRGPVLHIPGPFCTPQVGSTHHGPVIHTTGSFYTPRARSTHIGLVLLTTGPYSAQLNCRTVSALKPLKCVLEWVSIEESFMLFYTIPDVIFRYLFVSNYSCCHTTKI